MPSRVRSLRANSWMPGPRPGMTVGAQPPWRFLVPVRVESVSGLAARPLWQTPGTRMTTTAEPAARRPGAATIRWALDNLVWFILLVIIAGCSIGIPGFFQTGIFLNIAY